MKKTVLLIIVMACGFMSTQAMAQKFPAYYPKSFQETGVIDAVNLGKGKIIIGDIAYQVSPQVVLDRVRTPSTSAVWPQQRPTSPRQV